MKSFERYTTDFLKTVIPTLPLLCGRHSAQILQCAMEMREPSDKAVNVLDLLDIDVVAELKGLEDVCHGCDLFAPNSFFPKS